MTTTTIRNTTDNPRYRCVCCGEPVSVLRWEEAGRRTCMVCGEANAQATRHTIVPMPKSNYIVVTDRELLQGLNSSHRGNR